DRTSYRVEGERDLSENDFSGALVGAAGRTQALQKQSQQQNAKGGPHCDAAQLDSLERCASCCLCCAISSRSSSVERFSHGLPSVISLKKSGMKKMARKVAASMPPMTPVPTACRAPAPAPIEMASGSTPRMKASDVIRIGRKRRRAASRAAADVDR